MKIITIKQPWATLIAEGYKKYEFRSWQTKYRGPLLIHAGKGIDKEAMTKFRHINLEYPSSQIIAIVNLDGCILIDDKFNKQLLKENCEIYGVNAKMGTYAWQLSHVKKINNKEYVKGQLGLWNIQQ